MPKGQSYSKLAQQLGILLALADDDVHQRAVALHQIWGTMARLKKESPIFSCSLFARNIARTVFPADAQKQSETFALLLDRSDAKIGRVA
jgi:hypothetical protein